MIILIKNLYFYISLKIKNMSISLIQHKGKEIVYVDYSHCKTEKELLSVIYELKDFYKDKTGTYSSLSDFTGTFGTRNFIKEANRLGKEVFDARTDKSAALGITGIRKILLTAYNAVMKNKLVPFENKNDALEYLVK